MSSGRSLSPLQSPRASPPQPQGRCGQPHTLTFTRPQPAVAGAAPLAGTGRAGRGPLTGTSGASGPGGPPPLYSWVRGRSPRGNSGPAGTPPPSVLSRRRRWRTNRRRAGACPLFITFAGSGLAEPGRAPVRPVPSRPPC